MVTVRGDTVHEVTTTDDLRLDYSMDNPKAKKQKKKQKLLDLESKTRVSDDGSIEIMTITKLWEFNQEVIRKALAKMLIVDEV
ncbi:hypothetical protein L1987_43005 [Smallanthus sonchifolius]|uniref:Uncharacterized protein n=1 Tax=Smallanthus sonchifolius TaxID=185202 RepID=A0ACB9GK69_9ASTR|nr:hypothetical protein L1987_43005 [Smallanthus sonchifolius]